MPALPEPAPGAQPALALLERGERAAARDLHGRANGLAPGGGDAVYGRHVPCEFLPGLSQEDVRRVYYYAIFPNMLLSLHPDYMLVHTLWPLAPDRTVNICEWHFHPHTLGQTGFNASDAIDFWDMTNRQDWLVCELSQAGITSRAYTPGPYSNREDLLYAFDRMIVELHNRA